MSCREHTEVLNRRKIVKYGGGASDPETGELLEAKYLRKGKSHSSFPTAFSGPPSVYNGFFGA